MAVRVCLINNGSLTRKGLLRLCENVADRRTYKVYKNGPDGLLINNAFLARKKLLRLCENVAAERTYKIYQSICKGLLNQ